MAPSNPATAELEKGDPRHAAARRLAVDRYSWADIARRLVEIYDAARAPERAAA